MHFGQYVFTQIASFLPRDYRIFEEFAFHMVFLAQKRRITREFELHGRFYAVDSTTIDLCMSLFGWTKTNPMMGSLKLNLYTINIY